jgi:hypothetical protein
LNALNQLFESPENSIVICTATRTIEQISSSATSA